MQIDSQDRKSTQNVKQFGMVLAGVLAEKTAMHMKRNMKHFRAQLFERLLVLTRGYILTRVSFSFYQ